DVARQLTAKYEQQKLLGYFTQTVKSLTQTDRMPVRSPDNPALRLDARVNLVDGTQFYILRHGDARSTADDRTHLWLDLHGKDRGLHGAAAAPDRYTRIPQQPGTTLRINGRDSKILLGHYHFGGQDLLYSSSDWMTNLSQGEHDIAVIYGRRGEDGETVFTYRAEPAVHVLSGKVAIAWDAARGQLRLNYAHEGLARVLIRSGQHSLLLLVGDNQAAERFWKLDTPGGAILVRGPYLVRTASLATATVTSSTIELTGDTDKATPVEVFAPTAIQTFTWNGRPVDAGTTPSGSLLGQLSGPEPVTLPQLTDWKYKSGAPEIEPSFNDSNWHAADRITSNNPNWNGHLPILNSDAYGFHHGNVWYRGHFTASGREQGITLAASLGDHLGNHGRFTVWLNGHYLGGYPTGASYFGFDPADLKVGQDNVLSVLVGNMGHNQDGSGDDSFKQPRGLESATMFGASPAMSWKIQGDRGGEVSADPVRGPMNNGGLYGERTGWSLPGYSDQDWGMTTLPRTTSRPGVDWYRTTFALDVPTGQDVPIGLKIQDDPSRHYRVLIFINGWQVGRYINATGPQRVFNLPAGLLNPHGKNTIAIADWNTGTRGGLGKLSLVMLGNYRSALHIRAEHSPGYDELFGSAPPAPGKAVARLPTH
ncbi:MAG: beta galactosidase jelly roll domain-containing protein, partial [Rhodanobacter sp.]